MITHILMKIMKLRGGLVKAQSKGQAHANEYIPFNPQNDRLDDLLRRIEGDTQEGDKAND